ncbi:unnamed protein product, partial [Hapterophycus canaliculatus]
PSSDRTLLNRLFDATSGGSWTNSTGWGTSRPLGEWYGVTTDDAGQVTRL